MGSKVAAQQKISQLDAEIAEHNQVVDGLNSQRVEIEKKRSLLLNERCALLSTTIFDDLGKLILSYLKVQEQYFLLRDKIIELGDFKPSLYEQAATSGKHDFFLVVSDGCLKTSFIRDSDFNSFMKQLLTLSRELKKREDFPFPALHKDS